MNSTIYRFGRFELHPGQRQLLIEGSPAHVGARAFDMLRVLIERRDRVLSREDLFELVWPGLVVEENNLRQQVSVLRKLLGAQAVVTLPGRGYQFGLALDEEAPAAPPPRVPPNNLPLSPYTLIGREEQLPIVVDLLAGTRMLTLVGAGGVGKTRFALEIAQRMLRDCGDGVWWVELAPVADPARVVGTVASAIGIHEEPERSLSETVLEFLRSRKVLVVLDNCEHLIQACADWSQQLLRISAGTRILATSREPLAIEGEVLWRVPSLGTAAEVDGMAPEQLMAYAATQLFVQRAAAASPAFRLTPANAGAVARICHHLDGIPLALELAAARVKAMRVELVADRLGDRFSLLTRGTRTALQRHQTLRSLVDWSHDLLCDRERALLRRLSVFAGGWSLEAAEAVCGDDGLAAAEVLDLLSRLVEKSLVVADEQAAQPRYLMLETIRQYAFEKLREAGEADRVRSRHLLYFAEFAEGMRTRLFSPEASVCNALADADLDNLRAAIDWAQRPGQTEHGLKLIHALHRYWYQNMHWREIVGRIDRLLVQSRADGPATAMQARCLYAAAMMVTNFDPPGGRRLCEECLAVSRAIGFDEGMAWALMWLGYIDSRKRDPATHELFTESLRIGRRIADPWRQAALLVQGMICYAGYQALMGREESVEAIVRDCEPQIEVLGEDILYTGHCRALLGNLATRRGDFERASLLLSESLALYRSLDSKFDIAGSLAQQGFLALRRGDARRALGLFREALPLHRNYPLSPWVTKGIAHLLIAYSACERWQIAARLAGVLAAAGGDAVASAPAELSGRAARTYEDAVAATRKSLGKAAFADLVEAGRAMTREEAIDLALAG